MLKSDMELKIKELEKRVLELENLPNDISVNRVRSVIGKDKHNRNIDCNIYQGIVGIDTKTINFEFSQSIKLVPNSANAFCIEFVN